MEQEPEQRPTAGARTIGDAPFRLFVESVKDYAIFMLDPDGIVVTWNVGAERIKGYKAHEIIGHHFRRFYPPEDLEAGKPERVLRIAADCGRYEEEGWRVRSDGSRFWASIVITALRDEQGHLVSFGKVARDLTVQRRAMEQTRRSEERLRLLVESVKDYAIFMLDPQGCITTWNSGAKALKGYDTDEILGRHFSVFYTEADRRRGHPDEELRVAVEAGVFREEGWRVRKDGSCFWAFVVITALFDHAGNHVGFAKVTRDMTERRAAEEALREANEALEERVRHRTSELLEANRELEAFSYSVSHDLRAPLRALDGFSKLLLERASGRLDDQDRDYLQRISGAANRMSLLIDGMLTLSRVTRAPVRRQRVDVSALCREVAAELHQLELERELEEVMQEEMVALADPALLRIVFENLVANAWKFTRATPAACIEIGCRIEQGERVFFVKDNGVGFDMRQKDKLFAPFQRLHRTKDFEGTGIGLATVCRIVHRHQGRIWAEAKPGLGATFFFTLGPRDAP